MLSLLTLLTYSVTVNHLWAQTNSGTQSTLINPSFESGDFTGFTTLDNVENGPPPPPPINILMSSSGENYSFSMFDKGDSLMLNPTEGIFFALLNTVRGPYRLRQSVLIQETFPITMLSAKLLVDLNYMTGEVDTGPETNDTAFVYVTINETGEVIPVAFFSRDQLQPDGSGVPLAGTVHDVGRFKLSTGWKTYYTDLTNYVGKSAFLTFNVRKAARSLGPEAQNTALAIDSLRFAS
jgi:hypothetical protein